MPLTNISDLPDEVLRSEFPEIWINMQRQKAVDQANSDKTNIFLDQDNNQFYLQKNGSDKATRYNLLDTNKSIPRPQFTDDAHLSADYMISNWGALDDQNIFDSTNHNWDEIRSYLQGITNKINEHNDFLMAIGPYLDEVVKKKDVDMSEILADQTDKYYKKTEVIDKINKLQEQINNLSNAINYKPAPGGVFPPSYTGDKQQDINDKISDKEVESNIDRFNSLIEEEEGE
ncbi:hypothetical protein [Companilactobacillus muriivasis]|uniref:hypothetical protein n=1 Tax=Companilactobacillus muriivasis TaxID=3081444 RepID=UPI0030C70416